jgi:hypothetical protein
MYIPENILLELVSKTKNFAVRCNIEHIKQCGTTQKVNRTGNKIILCFD